VFAFGLSRASECWRHIDDFETLEDARAFYEKIKDLPEYLD
jgi:hypothetical protein